MVLMEEQIASLLAAIMYSDTKALLYLPNLASLSFLVVPNSLYLAELHFIRTPVTRLMVLLSWLFHCNLLQSFYYLSIY